MKVLYMSEKPLNLLRLPALVSEISEKQILKAKSFKELQEIKISFSEISAVVVDYDFLFEEGKSGPQIKRHLRDFWRDVMSMISSRILLFGSDRELDGCEAFGRTNFFTYGTKVPRSELA